jgi:hypothetical protein
MRRLGPNWTLAWPRRAGVAARSSAAQTNLASVLRLPENGLIVFDEFKDRSINLLFGASEFRAVRLLGPVVASPIIGVLQHRSIGTRLRLKSLPSCIIIRRFVALGSGLA